MIKSYLKLASLLICTHTNITLAHSTEVLLNLHEMDPKKQTNLESAGCVENLESTLTKESPQNPYNPENPKNP